MSASATAYDRATHAPIRDMPRPGRSSQSQHLETNPDGSVDIYFGPECPDCKDANWVPTSRDGAFEVLFRFYGSEKSLFDKIWQLPDISKLNEVRASGGGARFWASSTRGLMWV